MSQFPQDFFQWESLLHISKQTPDVINAADNMKETPLKAAHCDSLQRLAPALQLNVDKACCTNAEVETAEEVLQLLKSSMQICLHMIAEAGYLSGGDCSPVSLALHPPVYTCEQAKKYCPPPFAADATKRCADMKNLLLRDKKKRLFLVSALVETEFKLKDVKLEGAASGGLGFANEELLWDALHVVPGSVTPFGLLWDNEQTRQRFCGNGKAAEPPPAQRVTFHLDEAALKGDYDYLAFHPMACNATIAMEKHTFVSFIENVAGHKVHILPLQQQQPRG